MRVSVVYAALALLAVVSGNALRSNQAESIPRGGRRLSPLRGVDRESIKSSSTTESGVESTLRSKLSRRRDGFTEKSRIEVRARSRPIESTTFASKLTETSQNEQTDQFSSRKTYSRTRNRTSKNSETPSIENSTEKTYTVKSRTRNSNRRGIQPISSTETTSTKSDENKAEMRSNVDVIEKTKRIESLPESQFRRRSSVHLVQSTETLASPSLTSRRRSGRIDSRKENQNSLIDLVDSGTTNSVAVAEKEETNAKVIGDLRSPRKLRYKTRLSETDINLTGLGITIANEVKSSQKEDNTASQSDEQNKKHKVIVPDSTESTSHISTPKKMKIVRRPLSRGNSTFRPAVSEAIIKGDDEINEDDNYPESFKALIQAKNASTHANSPSSESLLVKESQKVYKTLTSSQQSIDTDNDKSQTVSRLRKKVITEEKINKIETTTAGLEDITQSRKGDLKEKNYKRPEYKPRVYTTRNRQSSISTTPLSINQISSEKPVYKFNKKNKITTTASPSTLNLKSRRISNVDYARRSSRPTFYSRRNNSTMADNDKKTMSTERYHITARNTPEKLYRRANYTKLRTIQNNKIDNTNQISADRKDEEMILKQFNFTMDSNEESNIKDYKTNTKSNNIFVIDVSSKESQESPSENHITAGDYKESLTPIYYPTTQKYHASYKDDNTETSDTIEIVPSPPSIKNIQRPHSRNPKANYANPENVYSTASDNNVYTKPTISSTNGITTEAEKPRSRFSAKYKASFLDKPFYKATVPTITPTTAWLKFFVSDRELTKSVQDSVWFNGNLYSDVTTEPLPRQIIIQTSPIIYDPFIEPVKGEEVPLGQDLSMVSFSQTRDTPVSDDLKLSESIAKPSQVINVEASHHSPSVTVSIFDALAEILTSTPRPQLSSTTEVTPKTNIHFEVKQKLNGVSNNINVNSLRDSQSQNTLTSTNSDLTTKFVQNTGQSTLPSVINRMPVVDSVTRQDDRTDTSMFTPNPAQSPNPIPTPLSPRRPLGFKILYSNVGTTSDLTTSSSINQPSTDNPKTVLNTLSVFETTNNNLVSSELTSMLSNNIRDMLNRLDEETRSRVSGNMAMLLKNLIPRAVDGLTKPNDNIDFVPETTPFTLEEIKDTEVKINFDSNSNIPEPSTENLFQNDVTTNAVFTDTNIPVNTEITNKLITTSFNEESTSQKTLLTSPLTTTTSDLTITTPAVDVMSTYSLEKVQNRIAGPTPRSTSPSDPSLPIPFLSNPKISDFTLGALGNLNNFEVTTPSSSSITTSQIPQVLTPLPIVDTDITEQNTTPIPLWVLSKKALVLKMIEEIIKKHNDELSMTPQLSNMLGTNKSTMSSRLTQIINDMNPSTITNTDTIDMTTIPVPFNNRIDGLIGETTTNGPDDLASVRINPRLRSVTEADKIQSTTINDLETVTTASSDPDTVSTTQKSNNDEDSFDTTVTTPQLSTATETQTESTQQTDIETTTANEDSNKMTTSTVSIISPLTPATPPKKDYVIFGILPNNTVVRKDPNDDVLEALTEASPYIVYGVLPNNTIIRRFPNGTRVPRFMQKIDVLPISPWSLRNPYSPIHNNPAIVRPQSNPTRTSTKVVKSTNLSNNRLESHLTVNTVNNQDSMISSSALNAKDSSSVGVLTTTNKTPAEKSTASHVLSLRTTTMLPSVDEILLNSISSAAKEERVVTSTTSSTSQPRILTLDIDPETKQIRTEKPANENMSAVFKFIPIENVSVSKENTNVFKLATKNVNTQTIETTQTTTTEISKILMTQSQMNIEPITIGTTEETPLETSMTSENSEIRTETTVITTTTPSTTTNPTTTTSSTSANPTITTTTTKPTTTTAPIPLTTPLTTTSAAPSIVVPVMTTTPLAKDLENSVTIEATTNTVQEDVKQYQEDAQLLQTLLQMTNRNSKQININPNVQSNDQILQALYTSLAPNTGTKQIPQKITSTTPKPKATTKSIEEDIKQFEEDTKLLKALLQATGQNPANFNIPNLDIILTTPKTTRAPTTTAKPIQTTTKIPTTTLSVEEDIKKFQEDAQLLQFLLQATGQNKNNLSPPVISSSTSNVRMASKPLTTSSGSKLTTPLQERPFYQATTLPTTRNAPRTVSPASNTFQNPTTENLKISTTFNPLTNILGESIAVRTPKTTTNIPVARQVPNSRFTVTTQKPTTSTFSVQEDLQFLQNLKSVLNTNNIEAPETALANRIIALAVEKSLNEIQSTSKLPEIRDGKAVAFGNNNNFIPTTTMRPRTTTTSTTTTPKPTTNPTTTPGKSTPSIEDDIKQFEEDSKLLQALLKATGQDPSKLNLPTISSAKTNVRQNSISLANSGTENLKLLSNLLASPTLPPISKITQKPNRQVVKPTTKAVPVFGAKIIAKDDIKTVQDDTKLLQTLIQLQGIQETTTQKPKITITGQSPDEALTKLLQQQTKQNGMMSEATQTPLSLSTEYGKSNDALLAALLKEQGFGPTTASSLDEQLRLAALLNQVVVTPKARRIITTTPPPPPPAPRRPLLDGLAWLWQQWRETAPGPGSPRPSRRPSPSPSVSSSTSTSNQVSWFGSGPFVGNSDSAPTGNRIPLEPPSAVVPQSSAGRGQLVSAAINVTRAFSQFLGAAIQGAAQTVQSVIKAGQRAASDAYVNGSG